MDLILLLVYMAIYNISHLNIVIVIETILNFIIFWIILMILTRILFFILILNICAILSSTIVIQLSLSVVIRFLIRERSDLFTESIHLELLTSGDSSLETWLILLKSTCAGSGSRVAASRLFDGLSEKWIVLALCSSGSYLKLLLLFSWCTLRDTCDVCSNVCSECSMMTFVVTLFVVTSIINVLVPFYSGLPVDNCMRSSSITLL